MSAFAPVRRDLLVVFDAGWDLASRDNNASFGEALGQVAVDAKKFPACRGGLTAIIDLRLVNQGLCPARP